MKILKKNVFDKIEFSLFVLPAIVVILYAFYIPFFSNLIYGFTEWNGITKNPIFNGLQNFIEIFKEDQGFKDASIFTLKYTILFVIIVNVLALVLAVLLDTKIKSANILRAAFFIPNILSLVVVGFIWKFIFLMGFDSMYKATKFGFFQLSWLGDYKLSFISVLIVSIWQAVGFYIVIYIAGLQSVPGDILEASTIDGAGPVRRFFSIVLPMLMPSISTCFFIAMTNSIKVFDVIISLTGGGPARATASIAYDIFTEAFTNSRYGYGTAKSILLFAVVLIITVIQVRFFKSKEVEV